MDKHLHYKNSFVNEHTIYFFIFHGKNLLQTLQVFIYHTQREITA